MRVPCQFYFLRVRGDCGISEGISLVIWKNERSVTRDTPLIFAKLEMKIFSNVFEQKQFFIFKSHKIH